MSRDLTYTVCTAAVYLAVAAALLLASQFGFSWAVEGDFIGVAARLSHGSLLFLSEDSALQVAAWMISPLYSVVERLLGGTEGIVAVFRVINLVTCLLIAVAIRRILATPLGNLGASGVGLCFLIFTCLAEPGLTISSLCCFFVTIMMLAGYRLRVALIHDDGTPSARRVLSPLIAGAAFALTCILDPRMLPLLTALCIIGFALTCRSGKMHPGKVLIWCFVGGMAAVAVVAMLMLRSIDIITLGCGLLPWLSSCADLPFNWCPLLMVCSGVEILCLMKSIGSQSGNWGKASATLVICAALFAGCVHLLPVTLSPRAVTVNEGIASGIKIEQDQAADYEGLTALSSLAKEGSAWATPSGIWLASTNSDATSLMSSEWVLIPSDDLLARRVTSISVEEAHQARERVEKSGNFALFASNDCGCLYKRVDQPSFIG